MGEDTKRALRGNEPGKRAKRSSRNANGSRHGRRRRESRYPCFRKEDGGIYAQSPDRRSDAGGTGDPRIRLRSRACCGRVIFFVRSVCDNAKHI